MKSKYCDVIMCQTYLVTGGYNGKATHTDPLNSTELLVEKATAWTFSGQLPTPRDGLRGANIDGRILMTGNKLRLLIRELFGFASHEIHY